MSKYPAPILPPLSLRMNFKHIDLSTPGLDLITNPLARLLDLCAAHLISGSYKPGSIDTALIDRVAITLNTGSPQEIPTWSITFNIAEADASWPLVVDRDLAGPETQTLIHEADAACANLFPWPASLIYTARSSGLSNRQKMALRNLENRKTEDVS